MGHLDHGDLVSQEPIAHDHIALGDVQSLFRHTRGHQEVQGAIPELANHILLFLLGAGEDRQDGTRGDFPLPALRPAQSPWFIPFTQSLGSFSEGT